jgi:large subunit ribosomal protein L29
MKASELKELTAVELSQRLQDTQKELFNLRVQQSYGQLEKSSRIRELRRDVARIMTVIGQQRGQESKKA